MVEQRGAVRVRVPATAANLGPGFDSLGLALDLHDDVTARVTPAGLSVQITGEGAGTLRRDRRHLVVSAMRETFDVLGARPPGLEISCVNRIPHGRGLGSSAAAIVAGVCAARALVGGELTDERALALAARIEGHPDNVAACLLGGFTIAWTGADGAARAVRHPVSPLVSAVAFVPAGRQSTAEARTLLPAEVGHADAAFTAGRAALLVHALSAAPHLLPEATADRLHEPYRLAAQPEGLALCGSLRAAGVAAVLSGSGPTVLALPVGPDQVVRALAAAGPGWQPHRLRAAVDGACARWEDESAAADADTGDEPG